MGYTFRPFNASSNSTNYGATRTARVKVLIEEDGVGGAGKAFTMELSHETLNLMWQYSREYVPRGEPPLFDALAWVTEYGAEAQAHRRRRAEQERQIWEEFQRATRAANGAFRHINFEYYHRAPKPPTLRAQVAMLITDGDTTGLLKLSDDRLYRKAQRSCHPDTGGSHEKWLKLQELAKKLGW